MGITGRKRPSAPCTNTAPRFVIKRGRCYLALRIRDEMGPCESNPRVWRPNNWQRVSKDQRGES